MLTRDQKIAAARKFAPPLIVTAKVDRRGAALRTVNRRAVDYARRGGFRLEEVYPGGLAQVRAIAPPRGSPDADKFLRATGLSVAAVYPPPHVLAAQRSRIGADAPLIGAAPARWRWRWSALGAVAGAMAGGPVYAAAGLVLGGVPLLLKRSG